MDVEWIEDFFDTAATWWGPPKPRFSDEQRCTLVERWCGPGCKRILDLGAGGGTTATALAARGHRVTAVELSAARVEHARSLLAAHPNLEVRLLHGDFYTLDVGGGFDCVTYWNGFGVGTDDDERRLLRRVSETWLAPGGSLILDVFSPWRWSREAGTVNSVQYAVPLVNAIDYDPVSSRFIDRWWPEGREDAAVTQYARCYAPVDLVLLLDGSPFRVAALESLGQEFRSDDERSSGDGALWNAWQYQAHLVIDV